MFKVVKTGKKTAKKGMSDLPFEEARSATGLSFDCSRILADSYTEEQRCF
jgi:hypothetical protein